MILTSQLYLENHLHPNSIHNYIVHPRRLHHRFLTDLTHSEPNLWQPDMASPQTQPTISVRRHLFASPEGRHLVDLLDADLASLYPDWDDLAHPGMHHENNPRPPPIEQTDTFTQPSSTQQLRNGAVRVAELKAANITLAKEELSADVIFFVALQVFNFIICQQRPRGRNRLWRNPPLQPHLEALTSSARSNPQVRRDQAHVRASRCTRPRRVEAAPG